MNRKSSERFVFDSKTFLNTVIGWIESITLVLKIAPIALIVVMFIWFFIKTMMEAHHVARDQRQQQRQHQTSP